MKKFYIGERINPQLKKPYFKAFWKLTRKEVKAKENCVYGSMKLISFENKEEYIEKINTLRKEGFNIISWDI